MIAHLHIFTCNTGYLVVFVDTDQFLRITKLTFKAWDFKTLLTLSYLKKML